MRITTTVICTINLLIIYLIYEIFNVPSLFYYYHFLFIQIHKLTSNEHVSVPFKKKKHPLCHRNIDTLRLLVHPVRTDMIFPGIFLFHFSFFLFFFS